MFNRTASGDARLAASSPKGTLRHWIAASVLGFLVLYGAAYGVARWRKYIVMSASRNKEEGLIVKHPQPGFDLRSGWRGQARNDAMFAFFRPLCVLEDLARGGITRDR
jgi:hypothetical protein